MLAQVLLTPSLFELWFFIRERDIQFCPGVTKDGTRTIRAMNLAVAQRTTENSLLTWEQFLKGMVHGGYVDIPDRIVKVAIENARQHLMRVDGVLTMQTKLAQGISRYQALEETADLLLERYSVQRMVNLEELDPICCEQLEEIAIHRGPH